MLKGRLVVQYFIDFCSTLVLHEGIVLIYFEDVVLGKKRVNYNAGRRLFTGMVPGTSTVPVLVP